MFHLKFRRVIEKVDHETNVACQSYDVMRHKNSAVVSAYKGLTHEVGVDFNVGPATMEGPHRYDVCFVTNDAGKTVDRIGPFN